MIRFYAVPVWVRMWRQVVAAVHRLPYWTRVAGLAGIMAIIVGFAWMLATKDRYYISDAQLKLLGVSGIDASKIKQTPTAFEYNMGDDVKDDVVKKFVLAASTSDSTAETPYQALLPKSSDGNLKFGDAKGQLSFSMTSKDKAGEGRVVEDRVVYPTKAGSKSVYTFKRNGVKQDILLDKAPGKTISYSWKLNLGDKLEARMLPNGGVGIYAASPYLFGDLQVADEKSQELIDNARRNGEKEYLLFALPEPFIVESNGNRNFEDVSYALKGDELTLEARNLTNKQYPISIDPTVVVTTSADFATGAYDGMIDYSTADEIRRTNVTVGTSSSFTKNSTYFLDARRVATTIASNGYMYLIGGDLAGGTNNCSVPSSIGSDCNDVQYAPINADGSVGTFTRTSNYIQARSTRAAVIYNGYLYILGGGMSSFTTTCKDNTSTTVNFCNDVQYAPINPTNGTIGTFTTTSYFATPRGGHTAFAYNGYMYIAGGNITSSAASCKNAGATSSAYCNDVQYAPINADGSVGTFVTSPNYFSMPRARHATVVHNGYMYIMGGEMPTSSTSCKNTGANTPYCNDVQYARLNPDGSIGAFTTNATYFLYPRSATASVTYGGYLYVIGGSQVTSDTNCNNIAVSTTYCDDVQYAPINADGSVGTFTTNSNHLWYPRHSHGATIYNGRMYVAGGRQYVSDANCKSSGSSAYCNDVQYASFDTGTPSFGSVGAFNTAGNTNYFSIPRNGHASIAYNGYLYVTGGLRTDSASTCKNTGTSTYCNDVQYAPINADGSVGTFTTTSYFAVPRYGHTTVAYNGYMYVMGGVQASSDSACKDGGSPASTYCNDVQYAPINADGSVGTFTANSNYFSIPRSAHVAVIYNGYVYITGGTPYDPSASCETGDTSSYCNDVQYAPINANGSIGTFTATSNFTRSRYGHTALAYNGYFYIMGGNRGASDTNCKNAGATASTRCNDVQYAPINSNGSLGAFTTNSNYFSVPRYDHSAAAYNGYMYIVGGSIDTDSTTECKNTGVASSRCNDVQYAPINANGSIGTFTTSTNYFATPRSEQATVAYGGYVYVIGGSLAGTDTACKDVGATTSVRCSDIQRVPVNSPVQQATYERVLDIGVAAPNVSIDSIKADGQAACGMHLAYRTAGTDKVFGSTINVYAVRPGNDVSINATSKRYVWVKYALDDQTCGGTSSITAITLTWHYLPPSAPTLSAPANGALNQSLTPQFQFRSTQLNNDYLQYKIEICSTSNCSSVVRTIDQTASQTGWSGQDQQTGTAYAGNASIELSTMAIHTYQSPQLNTNSQYWWRAYAIDPSSSNTFSAPSSIYTFYTNRTPAEPVLIAPTDLASNVNVLPDFRLSTTDPEGDYLEYKIEICLSSNCSVIARTIDQTASQTGWRSQVSQNGTAYPSGQEASYALLDPELSVSTQYWWRAYAIDPGGSNAWSQPSAIGSFTTGTSPGINVKLRGGTNLQGGTSF